MSYSNDYNISGKAGISETGISKLCVSINSYALKLKKSLDEIDDLVEDSKSYFAGELSDVFTIKLNSIMNYKTQVKDNVLSYVDDYNTVVSKFKTIDNSITFNKRNN